MFFLGIVVDCLGLSLLGIFVSGEFGTGTLVRYKFCFILKVEGKVGVTTFSMKSVL